MKTLILSDYEVAINNLALREFATKRAQEAVALLKYRIGPDARIATTQSQVASGIADRLRE